MALPLYDINDEVVVIQQGESANLVVQFTDGATPIIKANLSSLKVTLFDKESATLINSRNDQDILDLNDGTVATDGTLTLRLGPSDNIIVNAGTPVNGLEYHIARFTWTWNDGLENRTGREERIFSVEKLETPV